jgi:hypothetical protein
VEEGGAVRLAGRATGMTVPRIDVGQVKGAVLRRPLSEAHQALASLPGLAGYELRAWPGWFSRMPLLGLRVAVRTELPAG